MVESSARGPDHRSIVQAMSLPASGRRPPSNTSHSVRQMPVITENEDDNDANRSRDNNNTAQTPEIPEKSPRRSLIAGRYTYPHHHHHPFPSLAYIAAKPYDRATSDDSHISTISPSDASGRRQPSTSTGGAPGEKKTSSRASRCDWLIRRGGWYRVALYSFIGATVIVALVVGLVIGLRPGNPGIDYSEIHPPPDGPALFPAGSYAFTTALSSVSTACTSDPATFRCYPFTTYSAASPDLSTAKFFWSIAPRGAATDDGGGGGGGYVISTAPNPFSAQFANVSLTLVDAEQDTERFTFDVPLESFAVVPAEPLPSSGGGSETGSSAATTCYFNDTVMSATIWTRRAAEYPRNLTTELVDGGHVSSSDFGRWPYAVEIVQNAAAREDVPDCRDAAGNSVGDFSVSGTGGPGGGGGCACVYRNYELV